MTDIEMLQLAAKVVGIECHNGPFTRESGSGKRVDWSPLTDDGDALRLAGSLGLVVDCSRPSAGEPFKLHHFSQDGYQNIHAAIRRAIVCAAVEIGRNMK